VFLFDTSGPAVEVGAEVWRLEGCGGREGLWPKVKKGLALVHSQLAGQYDFLLKVPAI
jgi:hypothetical protein